MVQITLLHYIIVKRTYVHVSFHLVLHLVLHDLIPPVSHFMNRKMNLSNFIETKREVSGKTGFKIDISGLVQQLRSLLSTVDQLLPILALPPAPGSNVKSLCVQGSSATIWNKK